MYRFTFLLLFASLIFSTAQAQHWDYEKYPDKNVSFTHLDADIRISDDPVISGDVIYTARVLREGVNRIHFHAVSMNIISIEVNGTPKSHRFRNNLLILDLERSYERGEVIQIRIQYDANPNFGIHKNTNGTIWTSFLPNSLQHWLPVFENPQVSLTSDFVFTHPPNISIVANGRKGETEILSVNESATGFTSNIAIPVTGIAFVAGEFRSSISTLGSGVNGQAAVPGFGRRADSQIHIYSEVEYSEMDNLLTHAANRYRSVQDFLSLNYPFRDLHIVLLEEDFMEVKSYGAGIVYLHKNRGDLKYQLDRSISAQWAGVYLREHQWDDPDAVLFLQAYLMDHLFNSDFSHTEAVSGPYDKLSDNELFKWAQFIKSNQSAGLKRDFSLIRERLFSRGNMTLDWHQFSLDIYRESGRNYFDGIEHVASVVEEEVYSEYSVKIDWDEDENRLQIYFESQHNPIDELVTVELTEVNMSGRRVHELSFTGESDGVVVSVSPSVEYVTFNVIDRDDLILHVEKPYLFWISQLRDDAEPKRRVEAAKGLSTIRNNPDLQLALNDVLRTEVNPQVFAEILRSMSSLTGGASGTEERFIQHSSSEQHRDVQLAAIEALANFNENERVIGRLNTIIIQTNIEEVRVEAIKSLAKVTTADRFRALSQNLITRERVLNEVPLILNELAKKGEVSQAVEMAESFLSDVFPYSVRLKSLKMIQNYDQSATNWMSRLPGLLTDNHPGIRMAATESLGKVSAQQRTGLKNSVIENEFDERIRVRLEN